MKFPFPTPLPIRAPLRTPPKGQGAGHAPGHNCPPWARPPPLIIHLPEQSHRKPRASKAQSGGMPGTDHDRAWRAVQGTSVHLSLPGGSPAGPGPSPPARPAPARAGQSVAFRGSFAYAPPQAPRLAKCPSAHMLLSCFQSGDIGRDFPRVCRLMRPWGQARLYEPQFSYCKMGMLIPTTLYGDPSRYQTLGS